MFRSVAFVSVGADAFVRPEERSAECGKRQWWRVVGIGTFSHPNCATRNPGRMRPGLHTSLSLCIVLAIRCI